MTIAQLSLVMTLNLVMAIIIVILALVWGWLALRRRRFGYVLVGVFTTILFAALTMSGALAGVFPEAQESLRWASAILRGVIITLLLGRVVHEVAEQRLHRGA